MPKLLSITTDYYNRQYRGRLFITLNQAAGDAWMMANLYDTDFWYGPGMQDHQDAQISFYQDSWPEVMGYVDWDTHYDLVPPVGWHGGNLVEFAWEQPDDILSLYVPLSQWPVLDGADFPRYRAPWNVFLESFFRPNPVLPGTIIYLGVYRAQAFHGYPVYDTNLGGIVGLLSDASIMPDLLHPLLV